MTGIREWWRRGSALIWISGGALALSIVMITGLVGYIATKGLGFFWPSALVQVQTPSGPVLGEVTAREAAHAETPASIQFRVANREIYGQDFRWIPEAEARDMHHPQDAVLVERLENGTFIGRVQTLKHRGEPVASGSEALAEARRLLPMAQKRQARIRQIETQEMGELNHEVEGVRRDRARAERSGNPVAALDAQETELRTRFDALQKRLDLLREEAQADMLVLETVDGQTKEMPLGSAVRILAPNHMGVTARTGVYLSRLWEFLTADPRESNTEGGIFPAIFGTVMMVLIMSALVVPLGVMAALFLREYAKQGFWVRAVRIAVNNLAGVPSIVFGIFGLGFFVYTVGGTLDSLFFRDKLPEPTFGTGGILWAALTLALLTVPVVIVATEEALSSVPRSLREASLALGATKWQTMWKVVIPGAMPGILTGLVLAMARGAGEVAPLMLTGVVKLAPAMPLDGTFPYLHLDRKFMHLGFHIYDVGFQSPNSEAAKPMVFMTALLLLLVVLALNLAALRLRQRLRARIGGSNF